MSYLYSQVDKSNLKWFQNDLTPQTLVSIRLESGKIRGLHHFQIDFDYPITAIAGQNGAGKSTLLAMACCAYHNRSTGYVPYDRNKSYYTFGDFFTATYDEDKLEGVRIRYTFLGDFINSQTHEKYKRGYQLRQKRKGGRWNDYDRRLLRNTVFLGIQRIVPPSERKTERAYSGRFRSTAINEDTRQKILDIAGRVMGKHYTSLDLRTVEKRRLFVVDRQSQHYSGFNMGAGENAVFSILIELFSAGPGTLLVIDEIELGLHEEAQRMFIRELKQLCLDLRCQVICSTHSAAILDSLPPEGRKYIETYSEQAETIITSGISSQYATGKLSGSGSTELTILVEDRVGESILSGVISANLRKRIHIVPIGSNQAVLRQLAAHFREKDYSCIAFLDGDKQCEHSDAKRKVKCNLESRYNDMSEENFDQWLEGHLMYLPGETTPEQWLLSMITSDVCVQLADQWQLNCGEVSAIIEGAQNVEPHQEFHFISEKVGLADEQVKSDIIRAVAKAVPTVCQSISSTIESQLLVLA